MLQIETNHASGAFDQFFVDRGAGEWLKFFWRLIRDPEIQEICSRSFRRLKKRFVLDDDREHVSGNTGRREMAEVVLHGGRIELLHVGITLNGKGNPLHIRQFSIDSIQLGVNDTNEVGMLFWPKMGYKLQGRTRINQGIKVTSTVYVMEKPI